MFKFQRLKSLKKIPATEQTSKTNVPRPSTGHNGTHSGHSARTTGSLSRPLTRQTLPTNDKLQAPGAHEPCQPIEPQARRASEVRTTSLPACLLFWVLSGFGTTIGCYGTIYSSYSSPTVTNPPQPSKRHTTNTHKVIVIEDLRRDRQEEEKEKGY